MAMMMKFKYHHLLLVLAVLFFFFQLAAVAAEGECGPFDGLFVFGDSNSDTGGFAAAFPPLQAPNGVTYPGRPAGRMSDGRLVVDFLANALGLPFVSPYLQSLESDFRHGANFAVVSAGVLRKPEEGGSPFKLSVQMNHMKQYKLSVENFNSSGTPLPTPDIFGKALFLIYIGQNDFNTPDLKSFGWRSDQVVAEIARTTKEIYQLGGRTMFVFNLAPMGCYPFILNANTGNKSDIDEFGCLISCNAAVEKYNGMLKEKLDGARRELPNADLILVDTHAVLVKIYRNPAYYGFENATVACTVWSSGGVPQSVCSDPGAYVNWDGVHLTDAANKIVADAILTSEYFDPPYTIGSDIQPTAG